MPPDPGNLIAGVLFNVAAMDTIFPVQLNHQFFMTLRLAFVICPWFMPLTMQQERPYTLWTLVILSTLFFLFSSSRLDFSSMKQRFTFHTITSSKHLEYAKHLVLQTNTDLFFLFFYGSTAQSPFPHVLRKKIKWVWLEMRMRTIFLGELSL